jgi:hypothetical protein
MAAARYKPATVLVVNTLTSKPGEAPHALLHRNGLVTHLLQDMQLVLFPECCVPQADRNDRFNGVTMAVLELRVPEGREVPLQNGLAFAPSKKVRLASGESFKQRSIQICDQRLEFATPLPEARPGWPLPLERILACLTPSAHEAVLEMLTHAVGDVCRILDKEVISTDAASNFPKRVWHKLQALVSAMGRHHNHKPNRSTTPILPVHWAGPADLTEEDPCRSANDPAVWIGDCCHTVGIWTMRPGTAVPEEKWAGALLHAMKARLMANLLSQRAVPLRRTLRGNDSPKMPDAFWLSHSAVQGACCQVLPPLTRVLGAIA